MRAAGNANPAGNPQKGTDMPHNDYRFQEYVLPPVMEDQKSGAVRRPPAAAGGPVSLAAVRELSVSEQQELFRSLAQQLAAAGIDPEAELASIPRIREEKDEIGGILKQQYAISLPDRMLQEVEDTVWRITQQMHQPLSPRWIYEMFREQYVEYHPVFTAVSCHFRQEDGIIAEMTLEAKGQQYTMTARGNGRLDAVSNALKEFFDISYELTEYEEHTLSKGSSSRAIAYVGITCQDVMYWGAGIDEDIIRASILALCSAVNRLPQLAAEPAHKDDRLVAMQNYIQHHYRDISLSSIAAAFGLSETYISRYIRDKSGKTFGEHVTGVRMKKAKAMLRNSSMTVEAIAQSVGYPSVEHFNRMFKKRFSMTPMQYRNSV